MKDFKHTFSTPLARFSAYITLFVAILASTDTLRLLAGNPRSVASVILFLSAVILFIVIGTIFIGERNILSHITSFAVMLMLAAIMMPFDQGYTPDSFLLLFALGVSYLGAQPFLHRRPPSKRQATLYSASILASAIISALLFLFIVDSFFRIAIQSHL